MYLDYEKLIGIGLTTESELVSMRFSEIPPTGADNFSFLQKVWEQAKLRSFQDFFCCDYNKDVVPTLEAMQKMVEFYHNKSIDMLNLACTLPNLASSTSAKFFPFKESDKDLL